MTTEPRWNDLPSLVVYHVLKQLPVRDALNASACCLNWRAGLYFYDGHRKSLTLNIEPDYYEKNMFLWRMYAKYVRQLKLILAGDSEYVEKFIYTILPRLSESKYLIDLTIYATPKYLATETRLGPDTMDQSLFTEKIIYRLRHSICRVQLHGCPYLLPPCLRKDNNDGSFKNLIFVVACSAKYHEAKLGECTPAPAPFRTLQYLSMDYNNLSPETLESLSVARTLRYLVLNVACVPEEGFRNLGPSWRNLVARVGPALEVTINCISLPPEVIPAINSLVLVPDIPLSTLRMLFCRTLNLELVLNLVENYRRTLRELHWADGQVKVLPQHKTENASHMQQENNYMMNPFVLLCWHCARLEKLILHGYWHSAQDLLGIARLRASTLTCLQVSALALDGYTQARQPPRGPPPLNFTPVCESDRCPNTFSKVFLHQMKSSLDFTWRPTYWAKLHPALLPAGTSDDHCDYVIQHTAIQ